MPDPIKLSEANRAKLDGIVQKMATNNEPEENIKFVVEDFKRKYAEKKNSNSTSENPNSVSGTKTTSSASSKSKDSYIYERLGEEYMEANKDKPYTPAKPLKANYGKRSDGSSKDVGFLGELKMDNGSVMTENAIGVNIEGKEVEIPTVVPTLTQDEIIWLQKGNNILDRSVIAEGIIQKAVDFAHERKSKNKPFFYNSKKENGESLKKNTFKTFENPLDNYQLKTSSEVQTGDVIYERYQRATSITPEEKTKVKADLEAEINNEGVWNNAVNLAKDWWNGVFSQEPGLQIDKNPLIDNMKSIKKDPKYKGISDKEATKLAYEMEISKREANVKESKSRDFLADAQNTTSGDGLSYKDKLEKLQKNKLKKIEPELTSLETKHKIYEDKVQSMYSRLDELQSVIEKSKNLNIDIPESVINEYNTLISNGQSVLKEADANFKRLEKLSEEKGNLGYNLDLMKRDYDKWSNFSGRLQNSALRIASGIVGAYDYGFNAVDKVAGTNQPIKQLTQLVSKEIDKKVDSDAEKLIKPIGVDDINSPSDFGRWFFYNVAAEQAPILATTMIPYVGVGLVGASSMGQKHTEMQTEIDNGANYSTSDQFLVPLSYGAAETVGAYVDKLMIGRAGSVFKSASASERSMISNGMAKEFLKTTGKSMTQEGIEEPATQVFQNILDKSVLGKDVNVLDGVKDAFASSIMLTGAMNTPGGLRLVVDNAIKPFTYDSKMKNISKEILEFEKILDKKNLTETERSIVSEKLEKAKTVSQELLKNKIKEIGNLSNEEFSEVLRLEKSQANIRSKVLEIRKSENLTQEEKTHIEKALEVEFKANDNRRVELLQTAKNSGNSRNSIETESNEVITTNETVENNEVEQVTETKEEVDKKEVEEYDPTEDLEFLESLEVEERQEIEEELVNSPSLQEALQSANQFTFNGEKGTLKTEGNQVVFETETHIHELGNIDEISESKLLEFGIEVESRIDISINDDSTITIEGRAFTNPNENPSDAISIGKNGEYSVSLLNDKGQKRTIRGQRAEQLAYEYKLKEYENATEQQQQQAIEDAGIEGSIRQTSVSQENGNSKQKSKKRGRKQRSLKQNKAPLTKAEREEIELNRLIQEEEDAKTKAEAESKRDLFSDINSEETQVNSEETESYVKEVTQGKATYNVIKDKKGNFTVTNKNTGKVIPEFIPRKVKNGTKTVKNPIYSKAVALAEGNLTENQINEDNKATYNEAVKLLSDSVSNAYDAVLLAFANGLNISRESVKKEANQKVGGVHWTNSSVAENKLQSITEAAHSIWEEHFGIDSEITDQDIRNEIIDVISSFGSRKDIQDAILDRYNEQTNPYHNLTEEEQFNEWYNSLNEEDRNDFDRFNDFEISIKEEQNLTEAEQIIFYRNLYEGTTESLTEKERGEFYGGVQTESELSENAGFHRVSGTQEETGKQEITSLDLATDEQLQALVDEKSLIDKIISQLETWEKDIDKFGKETLGVAIPLVIAKETIKAMKLAAKTAKAANDIIKAGLDYLKTTDWYNNLSKADQKKINLRSLKNLVAESIREIKKAEKIIEKTELKLSDIRQKLADQKATRKEVIASVTDFLKDNKVNKNITPTEVNRLIREASRILTKADPLKAFDQFVDSYNKIISKGEQREANKLRDKTEPNRSKVIRNVERQISQGKSKEDIINSFEEGSSARMVAEDYFERQQRKSDDEIRAKTKKLNDDYLNKRHEKKTLTERVTKVYGIFVEAFFDRANSLKSAMNGAGMKYATALFIAVKGAPGYANYLFDKAYQEIFEGLSLEQNDNLNTIIRLRRIIAIENDTNAKGKDPMVHASNFNLEQANQALNILEQDLGPEEYKKLKERADKFFKQQQDLLKQMHEAGVLSTELYNDLKGIEYIKTRYLDFLSEVEENSFKLEQGASTNVGLVRLSDGWNGTVEMNAAELLAQSIQTTTKAIASNRLNIGFIQDFNENKANIEQLKTKADLSKTEQKAIDDFKNIEDKIVITDNVNMKTPRGFSKITYFENGEQKIFFMEDGMYKIFSDNVASIWGSGNVKDKIATYSGNKLLKAVATGKNPTFFITNTPRDFFWIAATSKEYSKLIPLAWAQLAKDFVKGSIDVSKDKISYQKAVEYGLLMDFLHLQGDIKFNLDPRTKLAKTIKVLGDNVASKAILYLWEKGMVLGKYSEVGFRMAIFNKATSNGLNEFNKANGTNFKSVEDINESKFPSAKEKIYTNAVVEARESSVDFNQGGHLSKDIEALIPYFNAGTQGTRMLVEKIAKDPIRTVNGILQTTGVLVGSTISLSLAMLSALQEDDDDRDVMELYNEFYSGISEFDRANYLVFPVGKEDGEYRYTRIAIPQALTPFFSFSRGVTHDALNAMRGIEGRSYTFSDTQFSLDKNVIPFELSTNPIKIAGDNVSKIPTVKAAMSYVTGYDFFREQQVSNKFGKVDPSAEGYESKSVEGFYKEIGYQTGASPARLKVATESLITTPSTNIVVGGAYGVLNTIFSKDPNDKSFGELALKSFGGRVVKTTSDFNRKASNTDEFKDAKAKNDVENAKSEYEAKSFVDKYHAKEISRKEAFEGIKEVFGDDKRRLKNYNERLNKNYSKFSGNAQEIKFADADKKALLLKTYFGSDLFNQSKLDEKQKELKRELIKLNVLTESTRLAYRKEIKNK